MGLISRVSSRTYRNFFETSPWTQNLNSLDTPKSPKSLAEPVPRVNVSRSELSSARNQPIHPPQRQRASPRRRHLDPPRVRARSPTNEVIFKLNAEEYRNFRPPFDPFPTNVLKITH